MWSHIRSFWLTAVVFVTGLGHSLGQSGPLVGAAAFGDWRSDRPGLESDHKTRGFAETRGDVLGHQSPLCSAATPNCYPASPSRL